MRWLVFVALSVLLLPVVVGAQAPAPADTAAPVSRKAVEALIRERAVEIDGPTHRRLQQAIEEMRAMIESLAQQAVQPGVLDTVDAQIQAKLDSLQRELDRLASLEAKLARAEPLEVPTVKDYGRVADSLETQNKGLEKNIQDIRRYWEASLRNSLLSKQEEEERREERRRKEELERWAKEIAGLRAAIADRERAIGLLADRLEAKQQVSELRLREEDLKEEIEAVPEMPSPYTWWLVAGIQQEISEEEPSEPVAPDTTDCFSVELGARAARFLPRKLEFGGFLGYVTNSRVTVGGLFLIPLFPATALKPIGFGVEIGGMGFFRKGKDDEWAGIIGFVFEGESFRIDGRVLPGIGEDTPTYWRIALGVKF